jgi:UDP-GlcNAc:undecaprenyl-phosphate GlcNAc-1-phosphate transferase
MNETSLKEIISVFLAFTSAMLISWFSIPLVVKVATLRNLTDPPGQRKIHKNNIPTLGGIGIFAGFAFGFLMLINGFMEGVTYFTVATLLLFFVGMKDDLVTIDPRKRLVAEIFAALILIYFTDIRLTNFHGFLGINDIPAWLTYFTTIFILIVIINSMNLIDGIDGLAASTGIIASISFGIWFWLSGNTGYVIMAAALTGTLSSFLRYNLSKGKNKIFMGDTGSLLVGFILAAMTIRFNEINSGASTFHNLSSAPAVSIAILIVPLFDTLRVFIIRILHGQHPFTADNRHIHHLMLRAGYSHKQSTFFISLSHIFLIVIAFWLDRIGIIWLSLVLFTVCLTLTGLIYVLVYLNLNSKNLPVKEVDAGMINIIAFFYRFIGRKKIIHPDPIISESHTTAIPFAGHYNSISHPTHPAHNPNHQSEKTTPSYTETVTAQFKGTTT